MKNFTLVDCTPIIFRELMEELDLPLHMVRPSMLFGQLLGNRDSFLEFHIASQQLGSTMLSDARSGELFENWKPDQLVFRVSDSTGIRATRIGPTYSLYFVDSNVYKETVEQYNAVKQRVKYIQSCQKAKWVTFQGKDYKVQEINWRHGFGHPELSVKTQHSTLTIATNELLDVNNSLVFFDIEFTKKVYPNKEELYKNAAQEIATHIVDSIDAKYKGAEPLPPSEQVEPPKSEKETRISYVNDARHTAAVLWFKDQYYNVVEWDVTVYPVVSDESHGVHCMVTNDARDYRPFEFISYDDLFNIDNQLRIFKMQPPPSNQDTKETK